MSTSYTKVDCLAEEVFRRKAAGGFLFRMENKRIYLIFGIPLVLPIKLIISDIQA